jgi:nucleotide-binding universal stress UspA family protein
MTRYEDRQPITVGVDGTADGLRAVEYAAIEAREQHRPIRLLHVCHMSTLLSPMAPMYGIDVLREEGMTALDVAERRVRTFGIGIAVDKSQIVAPVASALVESSKTSALIVVGRRSVNRLERVLTGSTSSSVASKAHCPVVSVPVGWQPGEDTHRIVVGVDGSENGRHAVEFAFAEASRRRAPLMALRSWDLPARWYSDLPDVAGEDEEWLDRMELALAEDLAGYQSDYPEVQVSRIFERSSSSADALCRRSDGASLLVIGKRGLGGVLGLDLGWTARSVLAHATCPVVVVHTRDHETDDGRIPVMHSRSES